MLVVSCPICKRRTLLGVDEVEFVDNLAPGVISVSATCPRGHPAVILTGDAFTPHEDPRRWQPPAWRRVTRHWWTRFYRAWRPIP
ncbi:hypothetical protein FHX82_000156 [Amycolatopsis bartoniae]|uniref:Uncharacterized protein n=1 Tax=Amycolatopsis bartoniae TaxID=941986 RepID=A0A8H9J016_9PSEU|nr:hypothetical protein [Amycolatopsis bartoniae]MBB2933136.1 hypothetical protein [Amycolatopsis bartoniae]TVT11870.1 hypothetical protein FNH07_00655 [Amycolatopsis bartoniae]GHF57343.1 hypothetical protein GCM10017566_33170 [Amycolatopsis bartoniae]